MFPSPNYPVDPVEAEAFVQRQRQGQLIATAPDGHPSVSILPFVKRGDRIALHCVRADPTFKALRANPRVTFFVADFLAFTPHDWVDPENAGRATLHFQAVEYHCEATWSTEPEDVAAALRELMAVYEPGTAFRPLVDDDYYGQRLRRLVAVQLRVLAMQAKFKTGPAGTVEEKLSVIAGLRRRAEPGDRRAADVIAAAMTGGQESGAGGRG